MEGSQEPREPELHLAKHASQHTVKRMDIVKGAGAYIVVARTYRSQDGFVVYGQANIAYEITGQRYQLLLSGNRILVILRRRRLLVDHALFQIIVKLALRLIIPQKAGLFSSVDVNATLPPRMVVPIFVGIVRVRRPPLH